MYISTSSFKFNIMALINLNDDIESYNDLRTKYIKRAKLLGTNRNKKWLSYFFTKKLVCASKNSSDDNNKYYFEDEEYEPYMVQMFEMMDILQSKYQENWDLQIDYNPHIELYYFSFVIYYRSVDITNTSGHQRNINDLVVVLPLYWSKDNQCIYTKVKGARLKIKHDEWLSGYLHSHLKKLGQIVSKEKIFEVSNFCIGTEDLSELIILQANEYNLQNFELMLFTIDSMVAWESEEGTPHYRMSLISMQNKNNTINLNTINLDDLYKMFMKNYIDLTSFNYVFSEGRYKVKCDSVMSELIKDAFLNNVQLSNYAHLVVCKKGSDGRFYGIPNILKLNKHDSFIKHLEETTIPFYYLQNKKITFNITNLVETEQLDISQYIIYPKFLNYVSEQLESKIYTLCVRGSSINRIANTNNNAPTHIGQNQISL